MSTREALDVRAAEESELDSVATLWRDAWHEAHAPIVPAELTRVRTLESFRARLRADFRSARVVGRSGAALGFCMVRGDRLYQLFVAPRARGTGVAGALLSDAESRLARGGVELTWLTCAVGNERAARFYEKSGWQRMGTVVEHTETSDGPFPLAIWRYEKRLAPAIAR